MSKLFFTLTVLFIITAINETKAQGGLNNNSDFKVPIPVVAPPLNPNFGFNVPIPAMPPITLPAGTSPSLTTGSYLPQIPSAPLMPLAPESKVVQSLQGAVKEANYPKTIKLPPLSTIPSNPQVRLAVY